MIIGYSFADYLIFPLVVSYGAAHEPVLSMLCVFCLLWIKVCLLLLLMTGLSSALCFVDSWLCIFECNCLVAAGCVEHTSVCLLVGLSAALPLEFHPDGF